jgi:hypothetical protein
MSDTTTEQMRRAAEMRAQAAELLRRAEAIDHRFANLIAQARGRRGAGRRQALAAAAAQWDGVSTAKG